MNTQKFDFIIVGAGSAGCVLADKLSESGQYTVLLIEAGGTDKRFWIKVPLGYGFTFSDSRVNWCYSAAADSGLNHREAYWPRGRVLGGSSSINAMAYVRGLPHDYDDWETAGAIGWNWKQVKRQFETIERNDEVGPNGKRRIRGKGPVWVSDMRDQMHPFSHHFLKAGRELHWSVTDDLNGDQGEGLGFVRSTVRKGLRWSSADAFLRPAKKRCNFTLVSGALVEKVLIENGRATGVRYQIGAKQFSAKASREVVVSAGAINSPQLLQLSGIGPEQLLRDHNIPVQVDLPQVGKGLQDHLAVSHFFWANEPTLNSRLGNWLGQALAGMQYLLTRRGPLSVPINQCSGFVRSAPEISAPDVQIYCNPASYTTLPEGKPQIDRDPGFLLSVQPSRPTSRGDVSIASADPRQAPTIRPNSLSTAHDQDLVIRASRLLQSLAQSPAIVLVTKARRAPDVLAMSEDELLQNFRERAGTVFHPCCTCRMGNDASDSVLDSRLRVHGIEGLRVIDASSFPNITSGNTNAPTLMLAARGAQLVLEDAGASQAV